MASPLRTTDPEVYDAIRREGRRQREKILLIASENFASPAVLAAQGSLLTNKYAEGYPGRRYYGGCKYMDVVENLAVQRAQQLFGAEHVNVQPHSGSQANMAVYFSVLKPGDAILGMDLAHGGHLTHGSRVSFSGILYRSYFYGVDRTSERIDYDAVRKAAEECRPSLRFSEISGDRQVRRRLSDGGYCAHRRSHCHRPSSQPRSLRGFRHYDDP